MNDTRWNPFLCLCLLFSHTSQFSSFLLFALFSFCTRIFLLQQHFSLHSLPFCLPVALILLFSWSFAVFIIYESWSLAIVIHICMLYMRTTVTAIVHTTCMPCTRTAFVCKHFLRRSMHKVHLLNIKHSPFIQMHVCIKWLHILHWYWCCCCCSYFLSFFRSFIFGSISKSTWTHSWIPPPFFLNEFLHSAFYSLRHAGLPIYQNSWNPGLGGQRS